MEARIAELWSLLSWPLLAVWFGSAGMALFWGELIKHNAKRSGRALGPITLIVADSLLAALFAWFLAARLFHWPPGDALDHAIGVAVALPVLCILILRKAAEHAPNIAEDLGWDGVPTQYRVDDDDKTAPKP
jgi:hypothetical protein